MGRDRGPSGGVPWAALLIGGLMLAGVGMYFVLRSAPAPAPPAVAGPAPAPAPAAAGDALVDSGRALYAERCVSCHGAEGRGDGPVAKAMNAMGPANLTDADWKHGDAPEQVLAVLNLGVKGTSMPGYKGIVPEDDLKALAAYVYHLGGKPVPEALR
jgi:cytochrome c oxidase cbb3-type subunit 3